MVIDLCLEKDKIYTPRSAAEAVQNIWLYELKNFPRVLQHFYKARLADNPPDEMVRGPKGLIAGYRGESWVKACSPDEIGIFPPAAEEGKRSPFLTLNQEEIKELIQSAKKQQKDVVAEDPKPEQDEVPKESLFQRLSFKRTHLLKFSFLLFVVVVLASLDLKQLAFDIEESEGPEAARNFIVANDLENSSSAAWNYFISGDLAKAELLTRNLLKKRLSSKEEADLYYLLSSIREKVGDLEGAIEYVGQALLLYQEINREDNFSKARLLLARLNFKRGDYLATQEILEEVEAFIFENERDISFYYELKYKNLLRTNEFSESLHYAQLILENELNNGSNLGRLANAYSNVGGSYALMGDYSQGLFFTLKAQEIIIKGDFEHKQYYNMLNHIVLSMLIGEDYGELSSSVRNQALSKNDKTLLEMLEWVEGLSIKQTAYSKAGQKIGEEDNTPPDPRLKTEAPKRFGEDDNTPPDPRKGSKK